MYDKACLLEYILCKCWNFLTLYNSTIQQVVFVFQCSLVITVRHTAQSMATTLTVNEMKSKTKTVLL